MNPEFKLINPRLFTIWHLEPDQLAQLDFYEIKTSSYWTLISRLVSGKGKLRYCGYEFDVSLVGKFTSGDQIIPPVGKAKSGKFLLSYRIQNNYAVCLIMEQFL